MNETLASLPAYLKKYCTEQSSTNYTSRDQAAWRYIMRQSLEYFKVHAVPVYIEGLKKTGITLDRIPMIDDMDRRLRQLGWGAVPVCGFIPPAAFMEFQARKILPIARDMRTPEHIHYTPAPDIVHEAAGHAPIVADDEYSDYLMTYGAMAQKAIFSKEDMDLYEAIRSLSDLKENPDSSAGMISQAESQLHKATSAITYISEANKVSRMNWWTVEYGLLGSLKEPKIYGAGLLSSVGESQSCLTDKVKKIRLSIDCINTTYDITEPQPQLFVAESVKHLKEVLQEFENTLSFKIGGTYGLNQALTARTITTSVLNSGLEISGKLEQFEADGEQIKFLKFIGPVQLAYQGQELAGHSIHQHPHGFSSPLGRWQQLPDKEPMHFSDQDLQNLGVERDKRAAIKFTSGFNVEGLVAEIHRRDGRLLYIKFRDCSVTRGSQRYFEPDWGDFDMAIGTQVISVFGGPAHREAFGVHDIGQATTTPGRTSPFTAEERKIFDAYQRLRDLREKSDNLDGGQILNQQALALAEEAQSLFPREWLLRLESIELGHQTFGNTEAGAKKLQSFTEALLHDATSLDPQIHWLIQRGLNVIPAGN